MPRPKKNSSEVLVGLLESYWEEASDGDTSLLKCSNLEAYAREKGFSAQAYDFRRDKGVRERMEEIRAGRTGPGGQGSFPAAYKTLDIDGMLNHCTDVKELKKCLRELDSYWRAIYEGSLGWHAPAAETSKESVAERTELLEAKARTGELERENRELKEANRKLHAMVKRYLYPAIAESLLREEGLPASESKQVDMGKAKEMIEGKRPEPFRGVQEKADRKPGRQEELMERLKRMVKDEE